MSVIVEDCETHPSCPHGPCLMFERQYAKGNKTGRRFFACSACRDRSECGFFLWVDDKFSEQVKKHWEDDINRSKPPFTHDEYMKRLKLFQKLPLSERKYCETCSTLILPEEVHRNHEVIPNITNEKLLQPSTLFRSFTNNKTTAQYFFSEKTVLFITRLLADIGFTKLLLIGTPKLHEHIVTNLGLTFSSLLLDIDHRYMQFYDPDKFCHYNMFNNHFFGGKTYEENVKRFLNEENGKVAILIDPPFGGLINAISYSLKKISDSWKTINGKETSETIPLLWFFPYFFESKIITSSPDLVMMDYKVEYLNHRKLGSKNSVVRIFSNIPTASFTLPNSEGYRFCKLCQKYVSERNLHCQKCNACTTKSGATYQHCDICQRCVKTAYVHCDTHNMCSRKLTCPSKMSDVNCSCRIVDERTGKYCPAYQQSNKRKKF